MFDFGFKPENNVCVTSLGKSFIGKDFYIGRGSPLGNIYSHKPSKIQDVTIVSDREQAIKLFEEDLVAGKLKPEAYKYLEEIKEAYKHSDISLVCFCKPLPCHGDVIRKYIIGELSE